MPLLEIACFNKKSALQAAKGGADRIELCHDYASGGLSPAPELLRELKSEITLPIYVMIRPHSRDFFYDQNDFNSMKETLINLKAAGADGFVFGLLSPPDPHDPNSMIRVNITQNKELVQIADGRPCTFHRAFDCLPESLWDTALRDIMECGFTSILTSGGPSGKDAINCVDQLSDLLPRALEGIRENPLLQGQIPNIIVGGGVRSTNIQTLSQIINVDAFHSSALVAPDPIVSTEEIQKMLEILRGSI